MTFHEWLLMQSSPIRTDIFKNNFVQGIGSGNLSQRARDYYVAQDHHYVGIFAALFDQTAAQLPAELLTTMPVSNDDQDTESTAHLALAPSDDYQKIMPGEHNEHYLAHMRQAIAQGDSVGSMLALLPCTESYYLIGKYLAETSSRETGYYNWIAYYTADNYANFTKWSWNVVDQLVPDYGILTDEQKENYLQIYLTSYQHELDFWQVAYRA